MADPKNTKTNAPAPEKQMPSNVVAIGSNKCCSEACNKKPALANFCDEHYEWFKEGLITKVGMKAADFDKKYHNWMRRKTKAA